MKLNRWLLLLFIFLLAMNALPSIYIVDNDDGAPDFVTSGTWTLSSYTGYNNGSYITTHSSFPPSYAVWRPDIATTETLNVYAAIRSGTNRTTDAPFTINHSAGTTIVHVNMNVSTAIEELFLGEYIFSPGTEGFVRLDNNGGEGYYIADAVLFKSLGYDPPSIRNLGFFPLEPNETEPVNVTARITDDADDINTATVNYVSLPHGFEGIVPAFDDGIHDDEGPNDGVFGASIPPQPLGDIVSYHFSATDGEGNTGTGAAQSYLVHEDGTTTPGFFILAGQSNASGRGNLNQNTEQPHMNVFMFGNDYRWKQAYEPVDDPTEQVDHVSDDGSIITTSRGHGFSLKAAKDISDLSGRSVYLIPCPRGGTRISQWRRAADPFNRNTLFGSCNYRRFVAAPEGTAAIWWYQGESDAGSLTFIQDHTALVSEIRQEMGALLPIIYVQLARNTNETTNSSQHKTGEDQRKMETGSGCPGEIAGHYMVAAFDLAMGDSVHINQEAQKELGRRISLATLEHVYGEEIDGTGPRLIRDRPLFHPQGDKKRIKIRFDKNLNTAVNGYDNQFRVFDNSLEVSLESVLRDNQDEETIIITLTEPATGNVTVSYGDIRATTLNSALGNAIKGENNLPASRFGPLPVEMDEACVAGWSVY
jgi:hypothetical protein